MASIGAPLDRQQPAARRRGRSVLGAVCAIGGLVLMVAQVPFFVSIALTAPLGARVALTALWLVQFTLGVHWRSARPLLPLLLAGTMTATWFLLGVLAAPHLGWTLSSPG